MVYFIEMSCDALNHLFLIESKDCWEKPRFEVFPCKFVTLSCSRALNTTKNVFQYNRLPAFTSKPSEGILFKLDP